MVKIGFFRGLKVKNLKNVWIKVEEQALIYLYNELQIYISKIKVAKVFLKILKSAQNANISQLLFFQKCAYFALKRNFFEKVCIIRNKIHAILDRIGLNICRNDMYIFKGFVTFWKQRPNFRARPEFCLLYTSPSPRD